jgi:hypothetical protein
MQEPDPISHFFSDQGSYGFTTSKTPVPAPGLKNCRDIVPIVVMPLSRNAFPLPSAAEHNPPKAGENTGSLFEFIRSRWFDQAGSGAESDKF